MIAYLVIWLGHTTARDNKDIARYTKDRSKPVVGQGAVAGCSRANKAKRYPAALRDRLVRPRVIVD